MLNDTASPRTRRLLRMLAPRSIAVIGGTEAARVVHQCNLLGFEGEIWPVSRSKTDVHGHRCYASLDDLPGPPDAAFIAIKREPTIEAVRQLSAMGAGGAVCYASGFAEAGEDGRRLQAALVEVAGDMPIVGPNCYGVLNMLERAALWPDNHGGSPAERGVAIVSQSGNMSLNFTMQRRAMPLAYLTSLGNQAMVTVNDMVEALLADDRVTAIGLHIEGIDDVARFSRLALEALERGVPLVAFKTGRSAKGAHATVSHTSTLSGSDRLYEAMFARFGIARVNSVPAFIETLKLLHVAGPLKGNRISSLSCSGGEASLMADRAEEHGLVFPDLAADHAARLRATLNEFVDISNPLDYHTFIWGQREMIRAAFSAMLSGRYDMSVLLLDFPTTEHSDVTDWFVTLEEFIGAARDNDARAAVISSLPECMPAKTSRWLADQGIPAFHGVEEGLAAIAAAGRIGATSAAPRAAALAPSPAAAGPAATLDEWRSKLLLADAGVPVPEGQTVAPRDAADAAERIGFPVVMKAVRADLAHKSEAGGVVLGIRDRQAAEAAAERLSGLSGTLLVERMVDDGVGELLVGVARDAQFGAHVVVGAGGTMVELLRDSRILLLPASRAEIEAAIGALSCFPLFEGWRGKPAGDIAAAVDAVEAVCRLVQERGPSLIELDVNPLIVRAQGLGVVAADALIRLGEKP